MAAGAAITLAQTPPLIAPGGVLNAASNDKTGIPVALGSLVSIYGANLTPQTDAATAIPLPNTLDGVTVSVNGFPAPIWNMAHDPVNGDQINAQIPWEALAAAPPTTNTTATVVVATKSGGASVPMNVTIGPAGPGIFTFGFGVGQAVAYSNIDGAIASATPIAGFATHPAKINDPNSLVILATGLGSVNPTVATGNVPALTPAPVLAQTVTTPTVLIGNVPAAVLFSGLSQSVGVYQLNVVIAPGTPTGDKVPLQIGMNGVTSRGDVTIAVSQ